MIDFESFKNFFSPKFTQKLKESIVPFNDPIEKNKILSELYNKINSFTYHPLHPREYIVLNKHNQVPRIVPTFHAEDYFLYYFCLKMLEDEIAENRVEGTYGGWRLGHKIRLKEEEEEYYLDEYAVNSFDPFLWIKNWKDFQKKAYQYSKLDDYNYFILFDISNFYNNINLDLLNRKIYLVAPHKKILYIELLFHFLTNWNRKFEGYSYKVVGLPQDEISDCSRILANFYLQDYDEFMKELCDKRNARYLRYADDQIIYSKDESTARQILCEASKYLFKINLDINSGKVIEFADNNEFNIYWAFDLFELLENKTDKNRINEGIKLFLNRNKLEINFKVFSVMKKILGLNFDLMDIDLKYRLLSMILDKTFLCDLDFWGLKKIYGKLDQKGREAFLNILEKSIDEVHFNSFHYNLMKFYKKTKLKFDEEKIVKKINELKI